ncbi:hypothetical protein RFI_16291, partial [Reticulomyxa filosa]
GKERSQQKGGEEGEEEKEKKKNKTSLVITLTEKRRYTKNDPKSNSPAQHAFLSLKHLQSILTKKNPSRAMHQLHAQETVQVTAHNKTMKSPLNLIPESSVVIHSDSLISSTSNEEENKAEPRHTIRVKKPTRLLSTTNLSSMGLQFKEANTQMITQATIKDVNMFEQLLPKTVLKIILGFEESHEVKCPEENDFETVAMFIDVSGFTRMSEVLENEGPWGSEKLAYHMNRYFEQVARIVGKEGGDIFKFAGDAMIIIWPPFDEKKLSRKSIKHNPNSPNSHSAFLDVNFMRHQNSPHYNEPLITKEEYQRDCVHRAIQCGLNIQAHLQKTKLTNEISLSVKIGIGYGLTKVVFVGGHFNRLEHLACGPSLTQAFRSEHYARPGDVIISNEVEHFIRDHTHFVSEWLEGGAWRIVKQAKEMRPQRPDVLIFICVIIFFFFFFFANILLLFFPKKKKKRNRVDILSFLPKMRVLNHFIPRAASLRLAPRFRFWHQEIRIMTVLFINLQIPSLADIKIEKLQKVIEIIQANIYRYEGSLNKFMYDDKGATAIAVFGLPPICNFDDPARAVYAALSLISDMKRILNIQMNIGITTGRVYCGLLGSGGSGCEYGVLGDLEQCEDCRNLHFEKLPPITVKGKSEQIEIYRPRQISVRGETVIYR